MSLSRIFGPTVPSVLRLFTFGSQKGCRCCPLLLILLSIPWVFSVCGGMQNSLPPLGFVDISFEAKDRKREGPVPSYIGAGLPTSVILLLPNVEVEYSAMSRTDIGVIS